MNGVIMNIKEKLKWIWFRGIEKYYLRNKVRLDFRERRKRTKQDWKFMKTGDKNLTPEEKMAVDAFWRKYRFAFKPYYGTFKAYSRRSGIFDPRYLPHGLRDEHFILNYWSDAAYMYAMQDKAYLEKYFNFIKQPKVYVRKMGGLLYDDQFNRISRGKAIDICCEILKGHKELIFKPSGQKGGLGIEVLDSSKQMRVEELLDHMPSPMVVQELICQHPDLARLNPGSVNSLRLTTMLFKGNFYPLAAFVKVGKEGNRVDNFFAGGVVVAVDIQTGKFFSWALTKKNNKRKTLRNGIHLDDENAPLVFPEYEKVLHMIEKCHYEVPMIKVISWDITVDQVGDPVLIEPNFGGDLRVHQALTGPILGNMTEEILDDMLLKEFYKRGATMNFDYREYADHIIIKKYAGISKNVKIPSKINGKTVTQILPSAFKKQEGLRRVELPSSIQVVYARAFEFCRNMEVIKLSKNTKMNRQSLYYCGKCKKEYY